MAYILIVEDEKNISEALKAYLESKGHKTLITEQGLNAIKLIASEPIDIVLLDLMLPDISGEEVCQQIRAFSALPIIMLTAKSDEDDIIHGLKIGADDYIVKPFSLRQANARVEACLRRSGGQLLNGFYYSDGNLVIHEDGHLVTLNGQTIRLTPHEFDLLLTLAKTPSKVYTREELIGLVMGDDFGGYDRAVDSHIKNIRLKIEADSKNPEYIKTVHGVGYTFKS